MLTAFARNRRGRYFHLPQCYTEKSFLTKYYTMLHHFIQKNKYVLNSKTVYRLSRKLIAAATERDFWVFGKS